MTNITQQEAETRGMRAITFPMRRDEIFDSICKDMQRREGTIWAMVDQGKKVEIWRVPARNFNEIEDERFFQRSA